MSFQSRCSRTSEINSFKVSGAKGIRFFCNPVVLMRRLNRAEG